jgi:hypothetical protein
VTTPRSRERGVVTNLIIFALWYWELDRGGPFLRRSHRTRNPDFFFPQMTNPELAHPNWRPGFVDYLFLSFTNATAFSPTDTLPLTPTARRVQGNRGICGNVNHILPRKKPGPVGKTELRALLVEEHRHTGASPRSLARRYGVSSGAAWRWVQSSTYRVTQ